MATHFVHPLMFSCSLLAFVLLALASQRPQHELFRRALAPATTRRLRVGGWLLLLLALGIGVDARGWALAWVMFSGYTSVGAGLVLLGLVVIERRRGNRGRHGGRRVHRV